MLVIRSLELLWVCTIVVDDLVAVEPDILQCFAGLNNPICETVKLGKLEMFKHLLAIDPNNINLCNLLGRNLLHTTMVHGALYMAKYLFDQKP